MNESDRERLKDLLSRAGRIAATKRRAFIQQQAADNPALAAEALELVSTLDDPDFLGAVTGAGLAAELDAAAPFREGPGARIGRYKLLQRIGEGGFGVVFMAEQTEPVIRRVALKIIKAGMDTRQVIARFEAERQALALMDHPNIARVLDAGATDSGRPYFVMELVRGEPVTQYCDRESLSIEQRLDLFRNICSAVQHAHQKGIIHRDLKPSNVLVTVADGRPLAKVIDFGIAKATAVRLTDKTLFTEIHQLIGTPQYMSPEQAEVTGVDIDTRSDVYALGVLLYELLAGDTPFDANRLRSAPLAEIQRIIRDEEPPRPSTRMRTLAASSSMNALPSGNVSSKPSTDGSAADIARRRRTEPLSLAKSLRGDLDWIVMKCLEKDRARRYDTAAALAGDITRYLDHEPVTATPPSTRYKLRKYVQRHRAGVVASAVAAAALILATGVSIAFGIRESRQRAAAELTRARAEKAEAEAKTRASELQLVAEFQEEQLSDIDARAMGARLRAELLKKTRAAAERTNLPPDVVNTRVAELDRLIADSDFTGIANDALEVNFFQPAMAAIEKQFVDQPVVKAQLLQSLADTLRNLGLLDRAVAPQTEALDIRRRVLGEEHPDTLTSIGRMGMLVGDQGKLAEAERYDREVLEKRRRVLGNEHPDTLSALHNLGHTLQAVGRLSEAEECYREVLDARRRILGEDDIDTLTSIMSMGYLLQARGKLDDAEPYYRDALEKRRRLLGDDHPHTLFAIGNMGSLLNMKGKFDEAEPYYREALIRRRRVLGDNHPETLQSINNMGSFLRDQGKLSEAELFYREALEKRRRILGNEHPHTLSSIGNMGSLLQAQGKFDEAEPLLREALEKRRRLLGPDHSDTLVSMNNMASLYFGQGNFAQAEAYSREVLEGNRRVLGDEHPYTLSTILNLARALLAQDKPAETIGLLATAEPAARRVFTGGFTSRMYSWLSMLGRARTKVGEFGEAETNLREANEILSRLDPAKAPDPSGLMQSLEDLYARWNEAEPDRGFDLMAAQWRDKLAAWQASTQPAADAAPR